MDCRNITTKPKEAGNGILKVMFEYQDELAKEYQKIEGIDVKYPVNLNVKRNQVILKDFTSRVIEEIAEGYESYEAIYKTNFDDALYDEELKGMLFNHLQNANEEQADAMGFFLELLLYIGITPEMIMDYISEHPTMYRGIKFTGNSDLAYIMSAGYQYLLNLPQMFIHCSSEDFTSHVPVETDDTTPGFWIYSPIRLVYQSIMGWEVTYHLNIARNYLKNKPWKRSQQLSDEVKYKEEIIKGFIAYCGMLYMNGFTAESFYNLFYKKNQINKFRQKSNY